MRRTAQLAMLVTAAGLSFYSSCGFVGSFGGELVSFVLCGYSLIDLAARETLGPLTQHACAQVNMFWVA